MKLEKMRMKEILVNMQLGTEKYNKKIVIINELLFYTY